MNVYFSVPFHDTLFPYDLWVPFDPFLNLFPPPLFGTGLNTQLDLSFPLCLLHTCYSNACMPSDFFPSCLHALLDLPPTCNPVFASLMRALPPLPSCFCVSLLEDLPLIFTLVTWKQGLLHPVLVYLVSIICVLPRSISYRYSAKPCLSMSFCTWPSPLEGTFCFSTHFLGVPPQFYLLLTTHILSMYHSPPLTSNSLFGSSLYSASTALSGSVFLLSCRFC